MRNWFCFIITLVLPACQRQAPALGDLNIPVFENTALYFDMALKEQGQKPDEAGIIRLDAGRVLLKKIELPVYQKETKAFIDLRLVSKGDPWDKLGSAFLLSDQQAQKMLALEAGKERLDSTDFPGIIAEEDYVPATELLRFLTPFGIGHFSDTARIRPPVYVDGWASEVNWTQEISYAMPRLQGGVWIGVFIDTWTKEGYAFDLNLRFEESKAAVHPMVESAFQPILNTHKYLSQQNYFDGFGDGPLEFEVNFPEGKKILYYTVTGHGGHAEGDEFHPQEHRIFIDDKLVHSFTPWRTDCAAFRRFNPSSGVWTDTTVWRKKPWVERIASSDLSRSNWCPGSDVQPLEILLEDIPAGKHRLRIEVVAAQKIDGNEINYWAVFLGLKT